MGSAEGEHDRNPTMGEVEGGDFLEGCGEVPEGVGSAEGTGEEATRAVLRGCDHRGREPGHSHV